MSHNTERNERLNRQAAFVLAISLHTIFAGVLYVQASEKPTVTKKQTPPTEVAAAATAQKTAPIP